jgi:polyisoprenoid-binding protein YceI
MRLPDHVHSLLLHVVLVGAAAAGSIDPARAGEAVRFVVDDPLGRDLITWTMSAPLELIVGTTSAVRGEVALDRENLMSAETRARIEVDLAQFRTGIGLRDRHLRDVFLETARYPQAVFTLERVSSATCDSLPPDTVVQASAAGVLELHGVRRPVTIPITLLYVREVLPGEPALLPAKPGNLLRITAEFEVLLADYGIKRRGIILQVDDSVRVGVSLLATDAGGEALEAARRQAEAEIEKAGGGEQPGGSER